MNKVKCHNILRPIFYSKLILYLSLLKGMFGIQVLVHNLYCAHYTEITGELNLLHCQLETIAEYQVMFIW